MLQFLYVDIRQDYLTGTCSIYCGMTHSSPVNPELLNNIDR